MGRKVKEIYCSKDDCFLQANGDVCLKNVVQVSKNIGAENKQSKDSGAHLHTNASFQTKVSAQKHTRSVLTTAGSFCGLYTW